MDATAAPTSWLIECSAGVIGGVAGILTGSPLDVVKVRMQMHASDSPPRMLSTVATILRQEGVGAFFRGSLAAALAQVPNNAIVFGACESGGRVRACARASVFAALRARAALHHALHPPYLPSQGAGALADDWRRT